MGQGGMVPAHGAGRAWGQLVHHAGYLQGVNAGADFGRLSLAAAWADEYKSPWFVNMNRFRKNDGEASVPWLWSAGAGTPSKAA